ncbi:transcription elongation factor, mitochondrial [Centropristis striata]|uniref:transcription elongation factor, mitochondrial n=1 Tax=Centropristis striata TaxID=184440 RepID=UPI0027DFD58F|nr:transcription elongation factor, mitochondrial [Centropristis striata]
MKQSIIYFKLARMWVARRFLSSVAQRSQFAGRSGLFRRPQHGCLPELEPRYLQCTCCWRSRVPVAGFETLNATVSSTSEPCNEDNRSLDACYTPEQRDTILLLLNNATPSELAGVKLLRGRKSLNIVDYRTKNGPFKTLESVVNVPLLKHKSAVTVFNAILNPVKKEKKVRVQLAKFVSPEVDKSWLEEANTVVSIVCGTNRVAWAHVDRRMMLLDWQQLDCPNFLRGTYMASAYLTDVSAVLALLPSADFYIVEKPSISMHNTNLYPIMAHMRSVEAMLFALLEPRNSSPDTNIPPRVLNMMRTAVGRHFGLMVGMVRTSGAQIVQQLMTESVTQELPRINFPPELLLKYRNYFQMNSRRGGEELCDALLQAVTFFELLSASQSSS